MKPKIIVKEKVYIPASCVNAEDIKEQYTHYNYDEAECIQCPYLRKRHSYHCEVCPSFLGAIRLCNEKTIKGIQHIGIPVGDKQNFESVTGLLFDEVEIIDKRILSLFDYKVKFKLKLFDYQEELTDTFLEKSYGLIEAPPRSGKTACMLYCMIKLGQRSLLLANQHEFLTQFLDHIHGNPKEGIPKCTNLPELEIKYGKKLYGIPKTDDDFKNFQIFAMTYQSLLSEKNGKDRFNKISKEIGCLGVDEVHLAAATQFAKTVALFPTRYKFGVTGTARRKDGNEIIIKQILGPVTAKLEKEMLIPKVYVQTTMLPPKVFQRSKVAWVNAIQYMSKDKKRNQLIVDSVLKDLANNHSIVIPVSFKKHVLVLQEMINKQYGSHICETFTGGGTSKNKEFRKEVLAKVKKGKIRVVVGIRSLLQHGLNVKQWSCLYTVIPISNEPKYKQETSRILTPLDGKPVPIIRLFVDKGVGVSTGCAKNCLKQYASWKYSFAKSNKQKQLRQSILPGSSYGKRT
jgi:superfamily II DNA or RNA helicase